MNKKVRYSITSANWYSDWKLSGTGVITNEDLIVIVKNKDGEDEERVFEDCIRYLYPVIGKPNEFKGHFVEFREVEFETKYGNYDVREMEIEYVIWYRVVGDMEE